MQIPDVALLSLSSENAYAGLDGDFQRRGWWGVLVSDVLEDIRSMLLANATDVSAAIAIFEQELEQIRNELMQGEFERLERQLVQSAQRLRQVPLKRPPDSVPTIFLAGEIFVRRDPLSRQYLTEWLAHQGFAVVCSPVAEWMLYADFLVETGRADCRPSFADRIRFMIKNRYKNRYEQRIKAALSQSGLVHADKIDMNAIIRSASPYLSPNLGGEAILTIGSSLTEVVSKACGVIAIGPFGCMPNRLSEAILSETMNRQDKLAIEPDSEKLRIILTDIDALPFLAIESDGSPFPQIINAKLEAFCLQARRLHERLYRVN
jgi:predicted nucleotide-binding protein (sugar kinase/HSP70/actin superfamily)